MYDLNDAGPQMAPAGELIPDGTFAKLRMTIRPGGVNGSSPLDAGLLKASQSSDALMVDAEMTVMEGPYAKRKFWQTFTVAGGNLDDKGQSKGWNVSKATFRAMIDSALGLAPTDMSDAAKARRVLRGLKDLDGIVFYGRIMVEPASDPKYSDKNKLANVVLPTEPEYAALKAGQVVTPAPIGAKVRAAKPTAQAAAPAWATGGGAPAATQAAQPSAAAQAALAPAWATQAAPAAAAAAATPKPAAGPAWLNG